MMSKVEKEKIAQILNERIVNFKCPMCGNQHFIIADGYFNHFMQDNLSGVNIGGPSIPVIPIVCSKCGFISQHAIGILGLLPENQEKNNLGGGDNGK